MSPLTAVQTVEADSLSLDGDAIRFKTVPCLLTSEELDQKCEEQFIVTWNGMNKM